MVLRLILKSYLSFAFIFASWLSAQEVNLSLLPTADEQFAALEKQFASPVYVHKIVFDVDIYSNAHELLSLTGLPEQGLISCYDLKRACWHLKRKISLIRRLFQSLIVALKLYLRLPLKHHGHFLKFALRAHW